MPRISKDDELDQLLIDTENDLINHNAHSRKVGKKQIKVRSSVEKARDDYKAAKRHHKDEIKRLKRQIKLARKVAANNVKAHRNMIATAKTTYKSIKLANR